MREKMFLHILKFNGHELDAQQVKDNNEKPSVKRQSNPWRKQRISFSLNLAIRQTMHIMVCSANYPA
jgi:hypothetical protein